MNEITTVGVDLAKEVIAVCAADRASRIVFTRIFRRDTFAAWVVRLPPCLFGARDFKNGRAFAAWQGIVPRQHSSGGKTRLGRITKHGDAYLRGLLTQGARSALQAALNKPPETLTRLQRWMVQLDARIGYHKTLVAIANKHARMIWAILAKGQAYDPDALAASVTQRYAGADQVAPISERT